MIGERLPGAPVYELLQNADDAMEGQATEPDCVAFLVTDDALWMANSGRALTDALVQGLCGLGAPSRSGKPAVATGAALHWDE